MQEDQAPMLATTPASAMQARWAAIVASVLLAAFIVTLPFGTVRLPQSYLFVPIVQTGIFIVDLVTAALLYAQFSILRSRGLLVLAGGCIFTAFIMVPHTAAILRLFGDLRPTSAVRDLPAWLYLFWHVGLPLAVIGYVFLNTRPRAQPVPHERLRWAIAASATGSILAVCVLTWVTSSGYLPAIMAHPTLARSPWPFVVPAVVSAAAIAMLWRCRRSVLDLWLLVMLWTWLVDLLLQIVPVLVERFSVGYYFGRIYGLLSTMIILIVLLVDATTLNARLVISAMARRRESDNRAAMMEAMAASIAHELRQPLTSISLKSSAGISALQKAPPDLDGARATFDRIDDDVQRSGEIMNTVRGMFVKSGDADERVGLDCNDLVRSVLSQLENELKLRKITVQLYLAPRLPQVYGNTTQLQQLISNLVINAADAMSTITDRPRILSLSSTLEGTESILISVRDTGVGIDPDTLKQIFEPFFTTKQTGMGMGLAICRWIVASHGGELWASRNHPWGSTFFLRLPVGEASDSDTHSEARSRETD
jgi:signal transduction histidine kinase